jgi:hypothetical protein
VPYIEPVLVSVELPSSDTPWELPLVAVLVIVPELVIDERKA